METPTEDAHVIISDGSDNNNSNAVLGLPLAAFLCLIIVLYGLAVIICIFLRQVMLGRRPLTTLESLHCCDCLLWSRPAAKLCTLPCAQQTWSEPSSCKLDLKSLWAGMQPPCRRPATASGPGCWPPAPVSCPSSVRCCGLEIRRHPGTADAAVSGADVRSAPPSAGGDAHGRPAVPGGDLQNRLAESRGDLQDRPAGSGEDAEGRLAGSRGDSKGHMTGSRGDVQDRLAGAVEQGSSTGSGGDKRRRLVFQKEDMQSGELGITTSPRSSTDRHVGHGPLDPALLSHDAPACGV